MQIFIEFDSIWQNSFLHGSDAKSIGEKPNGKYNKRDFKATSKSNEVDHREITKSTILGVLSRLIGDQRKLYDARTSDNYYFKDMEDSISFKKDDSKIDTWEEKVFLVNKTESIKRPSKNTFLGVIKEDEKLFFSETASQLWSVLYMDIEELLDFIIANEMSSQNIGDKTKPDNLLKRIRVIDDYDILVPIEDEIEKIKEAFLKKEEKYKGLSSPKENQINAFELAKEKMIEDIVKVREREEFDKKLMSVLDILSIKYPNELYNNNAKIYPMSLYAIALYIQVERMSKNNLNIDFYTENNEKIQGFSKRAFNGKRDFLNKLAGGHKMTIGTPFPLTKASGNLVIVLAITEVEAEELKKMIDNAGVSSFYLGKKGLAYVTRIDTSEEE